ncbi:MAG TPA: response regulator transcription factor [Piscirickettsiaceae bacterium]|nr:response regulator transcription factor [Piscirickettsiaceae bacterium]HIQ40871.1 response regulator transcription factor [Sulfurivirga caldicuralii]
MKPATATIALVEDDPLQRRPLEEALQEAGFRVLSLQNRQQAESALQSTPVDVLVADIILEGERDGGFDLARSLQKNGFSSPIIFLSERQDEYDIMTGHALGAIDYLPKPFNINILIAKINNLLKLTRHAVPRTKIDDLILDTENLQAQWKGKPLHLTATEFEMLRQFAEAGRNRVVTYDQLKEATQGVVERNTINTHICRIRNAFRKVDPDFNLIHNEYGRGYSWRTRDEKSS